MQTAAMWRDFADEAATVERLLSHGSTGVDDRAGQRAAQGRLRRADIEESGGLGQGRGVKVGAS
jgi:hypothetical protein